MLIVETIAKIRRLFRNEHKSIREISRELRLSRKVVRKALRSDKTAFAYKRRRQPRPQLDGHLARLDELLAAVRASIVAHGGRLVPFGHLAEGNVHVNVLDAGDADAITADVLGAAAGLGGTISAEHGVGVAKARWLHLVRTPAELAAMTAVKHALDPAGLLNTGVLSPEY